VDVNTGPIKALKHGTNALAIIKPCTNELRDTGLIVGCNGHHKLFVKIQLCNLPHKHPCIVQFRESHRLELIVLFPKALYKTADWEKNVWCVLVDAVGDSSPNFVQEIVFPIKFSARLA
jgi:hypothetical protein